MPVLFASQGHGAAPRGWLLAPDGSERRQGVRPTVLFVEDQPMVRYTLAQQLSDEGFEVVECATGEDAVALLATGAEVDALVTDLRLPGTIDGWDVAEAARELRPDLPVVYVSAYSYATPRRVIGSVMLDKPCPAQAVIGALDDLLA